MVAGRFCLSPQIPLAWSKSGEAYGEDAGFFPACTPCVFPFPKPEQRVTQVTKPIEFFAAYLSIAKNVVKPSLQFDTRPYARSLAVLLQPPSG
jgi:hypothetical protein